MKFVVNLCKLSGLVPENRLVAYLEIAPLNRSHLTTRPTAHTYLLVINPGLQSLTSWSQDQGHQMRWCASGLTPL